MRLTDVQHGGGVESARCERVGRRVVAVVAEVAVIAMVDISAHQGAVDFTRMSSSGVSLVIIRAGNGTTSDKRCDEYVAGARAAGLKVGLYWFCNPKRSSGADQGERLLAAHERHRGDVPPMLDVENYWLERGLLPVLQPAEFAGWLRSMRRAIEPSVGTTCLLYTNAAYWDARGSTVSGRESTPGPMSAEFGDMPLICARYPWYSKDLAAANVPPRDATEWAGWLFARTRKRPQVPKGWTDWAGWQFAAGFNGCGPTYGASSPDLDLNIVRPEAWSRWFPSTEPHGFVARGSTPTSAPTAPATPAMATGSRTNNAALIPAPPSVARDNSLVFVTNSEPRQFEGTNYGPGVIVYALMHDGTKRHVRWSEAVLRGGVTGAGRTNAELDEVPDYVAVTVEAVAAAVATQLRTMLAEASGEPAEPPT